MHRPGACASMLAYAVAFCSFVHVCSRVHMYVLFCVCMFSVAYVCSLLYLYVLFYICMLCVQPWCDNNTGKGVCKLKAAMLGYVSIVKSCE